MKIGLAGPPGSGKDSAASYFVERHSFTHVSTGDLLRSEASRRGLPHDRTTLQNLGASIRSEVGYDPLLDGALKESVGRVIFTGLRTVDAAQRVSDVGVLVYIDAPLEIRYNRCLIRGRGAESDMTLEEFKRADAIEHEGNGTTDMALNRIRPLAQFIVENADGIDELTERLDEVAENLGL